MRHFFFDLDADGRKNTPANGDDRSGGADGWTKVYKGGTGDRQNKKVCNRIKIRRIIDKIDSFFDFALKLNIFIFNFFLALGFFFRVCGVYYSSKCPRIFL